MLETIKSFFSHRPAPRSVLLQDEIQDIVIDRNLLAGSSVEAAPKEHKAAEMSDGRGHHAEQEGVNLQPAGHQPAAKPRQRKQSPGSRKKTATTANCAEAKPGKVQRARAGRGGNVAFAVGTWVLPGQTGAPVIEMRNEFDVTKSAPAPAGA